MGAEGAALRRRVLLLVALPAFLVPVTTTIYLPTLNVIQEDLNTSKAMVALTISGYVALFGVMPLFYGPYSDRVGRRPILQVSLVVYVVTALLCGSAWSIEALITFRTLQAVGVAAAMVVGAGTIADVFPPAERGRAMGVYGVAPLLGPILGPPLGGAIAALVGWRGIFYVLAGVGALVLAAVTVALPETLDKTRAPKSRPHPLEPLAHLRHKPIALWALLGALMFGTMYALLILLPGFLHREYGLKPFQIGLAMIPFGLGSLAGTLLGGRAADRVGRKRAALGAAFLLVPSVLAYAWTLSLHLAAPLALTASIGFCLSYARPGMTTYCIEVSPRHAAGITAALTTTGMVAAALASYLGPAGAGAVGEAWVLTVAALLCLAAAGAVALGVVKDRRPSL